MGRSIMKFGEDQYLVWSSIVDAPITYLMTYEEFLEYYQAEYGSVGMNGLDERMGRVNEKGTSSMLEGTIDDEIAFNRAGPDETCLTRDQIVEAYTDKEDAS